MTNKIRLDKFLWCVRLFKTRTLSNQACSKSKIKVNNNTKKSSYMIKSGDIINIKKRLINITIKVNNILDKRISAKLVKNYIEDLTPESEKIKFEAALKMPHNYREKGSGRPTKKERRDMMKGLKNYFEF